MVIAQLLIVHPGALNMDVNPIDQESGDLFLVARDHRRRIVTGFERVT